MHGPPRAIAHGVRDAGRAGAGPACRGPAAPGSSRAEPHPRAEGRRSRL